MLFLHLHLACASENRMDTLNKHLGSSFHFQCKSTLCNAVKHDYTHYDQITGKPDLVKQSSKFTQKLSSFEHGGKYCCHNQCGDDKTNVSTSRTSECCINVASKTMILVSLYLCFYPCNFSFAYSSMGFTKSCCS